MYRLRAGEKIDGRRAIAAGCHVDDSKRIRSRYERCWSSNPGGGGGGAGDGAGAGQVEVKIWAHRLD